MKKLLNSKKLRCGFNATLITIMFVVVVLLVNMLIGAMMDKFPSMNIDLSSNKHFEITDETRDALKEIPQPISMKLLLNDVSGEPMLEELLGRYKQIKSNINIEKIDIEKNPALVKEYANIDPSGTLVIENNDKYEVISFASIYGANADFRSAEALITNGIISITTDSKKTVLFSEGHGEYPAYGIAAILQKNYYNYDVLDITKEKIENCDMLVIYCPTVDFTSAQIKEIEDYVLNGGNLSIYLSPEAKYLPNLCEYIREWGIDVKDVIIAEKNNDNITNQNLFIPAYEENNYTNNIKNTMYYQYSYKLDNLYSNVKGITLYPVLKSTNKATTLNQDGDMNNIGEHIISMVSERVLDNNSIVKMYVSGSSLLYDESDYIYNEEICESVIKGILPSENYKNISDKFVNNEFLLTTTNFIFIIIIVLLLAIGILCYGIFVWVKRRKL